MALLQLTSIANIVLHTTKPYGTLASIPYRTVATMPLAAPLLNSRSTAAQGDKILLETRGLEDSTAPQQAQTNHSHFEQKCLYFVTSA
jgi:hypothetical protein